MIQYEKESRNYRLPRLSIVYLATTFRPSDNKNWRNTCNIV